MDIAAAEDRARADIAIVGYGPVGKLLAIMLGRRGHRVVVVDRNKIGYPLPRAVTHCSDFARILQSVGLAPDTIPEITEPYDDMYVWRNGAGQTLVEVDWSGRGESGWFNTYFFHQPALEDRLDELVGALPTVEVRRGTEAVSLTQSPGGVRLGLRDGGGESTLEASWLIGADGANSVVRRWCGIDWVDRGFSYDWLVVDVVPEPELAFPHVASQNCDYRRPATMVPGGPGRRRWEFMRLPTETREHLDSSETAWRLLEPFGLSPDNAELERHSVYTFRAALAEQWRSGRVLLAGDAAHLMPPFAGQGLGAGVRDAMNLSWKLDAVLRGLAAEKLLDSYGPERRHHAGAFIDFSVGLGQVICLTDPDEAAARDARMLAASDSRPPAPPRPGLGAGLHRGPYGGQLARQGLVSLGGGPPVHFDDAFDGPGALIVRTSDLLGRLTEETIAGLGELSVSVVALGGPEVPGTSVVKDVDGSYDVWLDDLGSDWVLVRPDFHLYAAGPGDPTGAAEAFLTDLRTP
ncbi:MAG: bifunctional 3-(3-hydroxy-phenyl)propionate/3-hydroxycinnamic acid hydroxylase [Nocardioides sp.]|uniref:bifunctional 3-(3-hydroxy-phenyl)propionate/3-hydroxycinnamic acid hydroxylase MhpA n=1 Tax=Nocardioides sp. TaxID=35761 RepID=UPI0039E260BE